jgi:hypothetical protein
VPVKVGFTYPPDWYPDPIRAICDKNEDNAVTEPDLTADSADTNRMTALSPESHRGCVSIGLLSGSHLRDLRLKDRILTADGADTNRMTIP